MKQNYHDEKWIGQKFGRLTVVAMENVKRGKTTAWYWVCVCECGKIIRANPIKVIKGLTNSCGCGRTDRIIEYNKTHKVTHGGRYERLYTILKGMKQRCYNKNCFSYKDYGARGIEICDQWLSDYASFRDWAIKNGYKDGLSIDRIDVNGNYCPENCRWVGTFEQSNNRRNNVRYNFKGEELTISEIAELTGIKYGTIHQRLRKGWDIERAGTAPTNPDRRNHLLHSIRS